MVNWLFQLRANNDVTVKSHLHQHAEESLLVLVPESEELINRREQTAACIHCDFRTVPKVHTEVLERTWRQETGQKLDNG